MIIRMFFTLVACTALLLSTGLAQPKIKVLPAPTFEIGDYVQGQKAEKTLTIKNVGSDTLRISEVRAQCGCTATMMTEKVLPPNGEGKLSITFDTHNYNGRVTKQVFVTSNDTSSPKTTIQFSANVSTILSLNPAFLNFDQAKVDSSYTRMLTITNPSTKAPIKILSVISQAEDVKVSLMKNELAPGEQTQLQAVYHPLKTGTFQGVIELTTDNPQQPKFEVKYRSWVNRQ